MSFRNRLICWSGLGLVLLASPCRRVAAQTPTADSARVRVVRAELQRLIADVNAALTRRDRPALERFFADEYIWVHANGYVNDRATHLREELEVDSVVPVRLTFAPPEELRVYGDVAVLRRPFRSEAAMYHGRRAVSTWLFARRHGRWQIVQQQTTLLQPDRAVVPVATSRLDGYIGAYGEAGRVTTRVVREGATLVVHGVPRRNPPRSLTPVSDSTFFDKLGAEYRFQHDTTGRVRSLLIQAPDGRLLRRERLP